MPINNIRSATKFERNRAKAIAATSFICVLLLTVAVTLVTVSLTSSQRNDNEKNLQVSTAVVFGLPIQNYTSILKNFSAVEPQYNATMKRWESHKAVTVEAPLGAPVLATFAGVVTSIVDNSSYGRQVTIEHRDGLKTVYGNLDKNVNVSQGDRVEKGQKIGSVGQTGAIEFINTPHLRIEVSKDNKRVDPNDYIDFSEK